MAYELRERYTIECEQCHGEGCPACRGGAIPVYVIEQGHSKLRCDVFGHSYFGCPGHVQRADQLPSVCWCGRCSWERIQTDVPEAYQVVA